MQDFADWNVPDPHPGKKIPEIADLAERAETLMVRNRGKPMLSIGFVNVVGAIEMMRGLVYHHDNFARQSEEAEGFNPFLPGLDHEVVAYFNRMGQFYYFSASSFVATAIPDIQQKIPTIIRFLPFRQKHSAHRSLDAPRNETDDAKIAHARALTSTFGALSTIKPGAVIPKFPAARPDGTLDSEETTKAIIEHRRNSYRSYQTFDESSDQHLTFTLQIEHLKIMTEAYYVIESVILHQ